MAHEHRIGLDIGFGQTKVVSDRGGQVVFPTAVAPRHENAVDVATFEDFGAPRKAYFTADGTACDVGECALGSALPTRSPEFLLRYAPVLASYACEQLGEPPPTEICAGLPLGYYRTYKDRYTKALSAFDVHGETCRPRVWCVPQGVGVLVDWLYTEDGEVTDSSKTRKSGLILDIGYNTLDAVAFVNGVVDANHTHMFDQAGISKIVTNLTAYIQREFGHRPSYQKTHEAFLAQRITLGGETHDLQHVIKKLCDGYFEEFFLMLHDTWGSRIQEFDVLLLAGGGAHHVAHYVPQQIAKQVVYMRPDPEFSNARGFLKTLLRPRQGETTKSSSTRGRGRFQQPRNHRVAAHG